MELVIKNPVIPIKAIPEKSLDEFLYTKFKFWLANLLSLKSDQEQKIDEALKGVKKHFWSLGLGEIKKVFEMYADSELNLTPVSNHIDRVLVGQIFEAYKQHKKTKPVKKDVDKEKQLQDYTDAVNWFDWWVQNNKVTEEMTWLFNYLEDRCDNFNPKRGLMHQWVEEAIEEGDIEETAFKKAKRTMVKLYFQHLHAKGHHLKEFL